MSFRKGLMKDAGAALTVGKALLFIPLTKIDETEQTVTGIVTAEVLDKAGEVFHYESSVPYFKAWSANFDRVSKGKSLGNVRAMHQPNAVGKLIALEFDDGNKCIVATAKIVDAGEWTKVVEGVYTGFSIGGNYIKQWEDPTTKKMFFTADPIEVSIVDNPCVPVAHFTAIKADGVTEERKFKLYAPTNDEVAKRATSMAEDAGANSGKTWIDFLAAAKEDLIKTHGIPDFSKAAESKDEGETDDTETNKATDSPGASANEGPKKKKKDDGDATDEEGETEDDANADNAAKSSVVQVWKATDGTTFDKKADCVAHQATIKELTPVEKALADANARLDNVVKVTKPYGDVAYAIEKDGVSLYPLDSELHIRSSWVFANKSTKLTDDEKAVALEAIKKAWVEKIGDEPPTAVELGAFDMSKERAAYEAVKALGASPLEKGFWTVGMWCRIVDDILCATDCVGWYMEESDVPQVAKDICAAILTFMVKLVDAEVAMTLSRLDKAARPDKLEGMAKLLADKADAVTPVEKAIAPEALTKLQAEVAEDKKVIAGLEKQVVDAVSGINALTEKFGKYMNEPEPRPALTGRLVSKEGDRSGKDNEPTSDEETIKKLYDEKGPEAVAQMIIKLSQKNGISVSNVGRK